MSNHIKLTKVSDKNEGLDQGYYVLGYLQEEPEVGKSVHVWRYQRNEVKATGVLSTSPVTEITENGFKTQNSTYEILRYAD